MKTDLDSSTRNIKVSYEDVMKRFAVSSQFNFGELTEALKTSLNLPSDFLNEFKLFYLDEENDKIDVSNNFDFEQAILYTENRGEKCLKLKLLKRETKIKSNVQSGNEKIEMNFFFEDENMSPIENSRNNVEEISTKEEKLIKCENCSRKFLSSRIEVHTRVCRPKDESRKKFDSSSQRKGGLDAPVAISENDKNANSNKEKSKFRKWIDERPVCTPKWYKKEKEIYKDMFLPNTVVNELKDCEICGRKFNVDTIERHRKICRNSKKNREKFNSKKKRIIDSEHYMFIKDQLHFENKEKKIENTKQTNQAWKEKSDKLKDFLKNVRSNTLNETEIKNTLNKDVLYIIPHEKFCEMCGHKL